MPFFFLSNLAVSLSVFLQENYNTLIKLIIAFKNKCGTRPVVPIRHYNRCIKFKFIDKSLHSKSNFERGQS